MRGYSGLVRPFGLALVIALCAVAVAGCGSSSSEPTAAPDAAPAETQPPPGRDPAPAIDGTSVEGKPLALADYRGRAVLVNVWSSW